MKILISISILIIFILLINFKSLFPKQWTFLKARDIVKFSKTIRLNEIAEARGWSKTYISKIDKIKKWFKKMT